MRVTIANANWCSWRNSILSPARLNRASLLEALSATLMKPSASADLCGFLLVTIDHLGNSMKPMASMSPRKLSPRSPNGVRARLRGKDHFGRFSGNKFGVVLTSCTPDELAIAAERLLTGVRDEPIVTDRRRCGGDGDDRRRDRAASCPYNVGNSQPHAGMYSSTARAKRAQIVRGLSAECRARPRCAARTPARHR